MGTLVTVFESAASLLYIASEFDKKANPRILTERQSTGHNNRGSVLLLRV